MPSVFSKIVYPLTAIGRSLEEVVESLRGILARLGGIEATMGQLHFPDGAQAEPQEDPRVAILMERMNDLTTAVDDGIKRVQRSENRVRSVVEGARKQLAEHGFEHPGLEAEARDLHEVDGKGGDEPRVPEVPTEVGDPYDAPSPVPGVSMAQFRTFHQGRR